MREGFIAPFKWIVMGILFIVWVVSFGLLIWGIIWRAISFLAIVTGCKIADVIEAIAEKMYPGRGPFFKEEGELDKILEIF